MIAFIIHTSIGFMGLMLLFGLLDLLSFVSVNGWRDVVNDWRITKYFVKCWAYMSAPIALIATLISLINTQ